MLKMFSTQLAGLFKKIQEDNYGFEDSSRLLAQSAIGDGCIYIHGFHEMTGIMQEAFYGAEPFPYAKPYDPKIPLTIADRVLLFTRYANDKDAIDFACKLKEEQIPFAAVATSTQNELNTLEQLADVFIDLRLQRGLIPDDNGNRIGFPHLMSALFAYYGIKFTLEEILTEYNEE
jgi:hypothetical protein